MAEVMLEVNLQHTAVIAGMLAAKIPAVWINDSRVSCGTHTTRCSDSRTLSLTAKPPQFVSMLEALVATALQCRLKVNVPVTMHKLC